MGLRDFFFRGDVDKAEVAEKPVENVKVPAETVVTAAKITLDATTNDEKLAEYRQHFNSLPRPKSYEMFSSALDSLATEQMDERMRFIGAFAGFRASGVTKEQILQDCELMLKQLDDEMGDFTKEWSSKFTVDVDDKKKEIEKQTYVIQELRDQILEAESKIKDLKDQAYKNEVALGLIQASFTKAGSECRDKITRDMDKIKSYL